MVDIIIRARNGRELTGYCVDSVVRNTPRDMYRLILVDDGSDPPLPNYGEDYLVRSSTSRGAVSATNLGLGVSLQLDGEYVLILDNDAVVPTGDLYWLHRFINELEAVPGTACVGATSSRVSPPQQILGIPQVKVNETAPAVPTFISFAVLFHKHVLAQLGPWDERYNPGNFEDTDYAVQVRAAGYQVRVARSVYLHHRCHATFGSQMGELMRTNQEKFLEKWGVGRLWDMGFIPSQVVEQVAQEAVRRGE